MLPLRNNNPLISLLSSSIIVFLLQACGADNLSATGTTNNDKAVLISVHNVQTMDLPIWLKTVGQVRSLSAPTLAAEVEGRITTVLADTGDRIEIGQLLAETDTSALLLQKQAAQAGIERLEVHIANGKRRVDRLQKLSSKNLTSQTQLDDALEQLEAYEADYKAAVARLAIVEDSLEKSHIVAPVAGVIQNRFSAT